MEAIRPDNPPAYENDSNRFTLPSFPTQTFRPPRPSPISLPDLKSLKLPVPLPLSSPSQWHHHHPSPSHSHSGSHSGSQSSLPQPPHSATFAPYLPPPSPMDTDSVMSEGRRPRAVSIMSLDDAETREAAETLSGLRNMDFVRTQTVKPENIPEDQTIISLSKSTISSDEEELPLLSLITSTHPWLGGTIKSSINAYESTMSYSPQFVQSFMQSQIATVGSISRVTGVETRVRQYFGDTPDRRKGQRDAIVDDIEKGLPMSPPSRFRSRTGSQVSYAETLPAYDDNKAPDYEQHSESSSSSSSHKQNGRWLITTSALGVALSQQSLRSLKYCLSFLSYSSTHLGGIMAALSKIIVEYERSAYGSHQGSNSNYLNPEQEASSEEIAENIKRLGGDIMNTLQTVTNQVNKYAGGTLPENASALVRRQLMSMPQRWRLAQESANTTQSQGGNSEAVQTGQRLLIFAEQGCDMIAQISLVLGGTVDSAEKWLDSVSKKRASLAPSNASDGNTVIMGEDEIMS